MVHPGEYSHVKTYRDVPQFWVRFFQRVRYAMGNFEKFVVFFVAKITKNGYLFSEKSLNMGIYFWKNYPWTWVWVLSQTESLASPKTPLSLPPSTSLLPSLPLSHITHNGDLFVLGPEFAVLSVPFPVWLRLNPSPHLKPTLSLPPSLPPSLT